SLDRLPCLRDHVIAGRHLLPGALYVALVPTALGDPGEGQGWELTRVEFPQAGLIETTLRLELTLDGAQQQFLFRAGDKPLCRGGWRTSPEAPAAPVPRREGMDSGHSSHETIYARLEEAGYQYGPSLRLLNDLQRDDYGFRASLRSNRVETRPELRFAAAVDAGLQAVLAAVGSLGWLTVHGNLYLPRAIRRVLFERRSSPFAVVHLPSTRMQRTHDAFTADVSLLGEDGRPLVHLEGVNFKAVPRGFVARSPAAADAAPATAAPRFFRVAWKATPTTPAPAPQPPADPRPTVILLGADGPLLRAIQGVLATRGGRLLELRPAAGYRRTGPAAFAFDWLEDAAWARFAREAAAALGPTSSPLELVFCHTPAGLEAGDDSLTSGEGRKELTPTEEKTSAAGSQQRDSAGRTLDHPRPAAAPWFPGVEASLLAPAALLRALAPHLAGRPLRVTGIAEEVFALGPSERAAGFACAGWSGLLRSLQQELPALTGV
ncbi:MAG: polyketide synthase dehydratase domain-containing protein, partial [Elusimicrobia bacterium]|nr:polyketide synthase dehydratase domain-containing protein [Elusimicrobiota bacterium]